MAIQGLSGYKKSQESKGQRFFKPKADQKVKIRPLTELDFDAKNYSNKNGVALFVTEYQNPNDFTKSFVDTTETEGHCVGAEMAQKFGWKQPDKDEEPEKHEAWENWRPKQRMYLPVLLDDGVNPESVVVLQLGMGPKQAQSNALIKCHENNGSIVDRWWTYSRVGSGQYDTVYDLSSLDKDESLPDATDYEIPDLDEFVNHVPYASQRAYLGLDVPSSKAPQEGNSPSGDSPSLDVEW